MSATGRPSGFVPAHAPEYLAEGLGLALFMISACAFATLLEHPASPARAALPEPILRRALMGAAMGLTAFALIHSPWGKRSGAHLNPAVTLAFWRLGHVRAVDLAGYAAAQFAGGAFGVAVAAAALGAALGDPQVQYVVTKPGSHGIAAAFAGEALIAFLLMSVVLRAMAHPRWMRHTGAFAAALVGVFILVEAPISGMSMNPARTFGSALVAQDWTAFWIYLVAPPLAMLAAVEAYTLDLRAGVHARAGCAKLDHDPRVRCLFCGLDPARPASPGTSAAPSSLSTKSRPS